jgi:glutathione peroxidase
MLARSLLLFIVLFATGPTLAAEPGRSAHDFVFTSIEGEPLPFSRFAGQVVLVVNTASQCGFTRQ